MTVTDIGTVLLTGPTRGLGRAAALALASRPAATRPDLLLLGRPGPALDSVLAQVRANGARAESVPCDLADLGGVAGAADAVRAALRAGRVGPLRAVVTNAAVQSTDRARAGADGFELTFTVNHLAPMLLLTALFGEIEPGGRVVLLGSGTYRGGRLQHLFRVPAARWADPAELARPGREPGEAPALSGRRAYATSKLLTLYLAHELQRRAGDRFGVAVFDPGLMPGTGLARHSGPAVRLLWNTVLHGLRVLPGVTSPARSGRLLAEVAVDPRWAGLRDGEYVAFGQRQPVADFAFDPGANSSCGSSASGCWRRCAEHPHPGQDAGPALPLPAQPGRGVRLGADQPGQHQLVGPGVHGGEPGVVVRDGRADGGYRGPRPAAAGDGDARPDRPQPAVRQQAQVGLPPAGQDGAGQGRGPDRVAAAVIQPARAENGVLGRRDQVRVRPRQRAPAVGQRHLEQAVARPEQERLDPDLAGRVVQPEGAQRMEPGRAAGPGPPGQPGVQNLPQRRVEGRLMEHSHPGRVGLSPGCGPRPARRCRRPTPRTGARRRPARSRPRGPPPARTGRRRPR